MFRFVVRSRTVCVYGALTFLERRTMGPLELEDSELLDRAGELGRLLFTQDKDLLREGTKRQRAGKKFSGIIYAHQREVSIGECVNDLETIAKDSEQEEWIGHVEYLPL